MSSNIINASDSICIITPSMYETYSFTQISIQAKEGYKIDSDTMNVSLSHPGGWIDGEYYEPETVTIKGTVSGSNWVYGYMDSKGEGDITITVNSGIIEDSPVVKQGKVINTSNLCDVTPNFNYNSTSDITLSANEGYNINDDIHITLENEGGWVDGDWVDPQTFTYKKENGTISGDSKTFTVKYTDSLGYGNITLKVVAGIVQDVAPGVDVNILNDKLVNCYIKINTLTTEMDTLEIYSSNGWKFEDTTKVSIEPVESGTPQEVKFTISDDKTILYATIPPMNKDFYIICSANIEVEPQDIQGNIIFNLPNANIDLEGDSFLLGSKVSFKITTQDPYILRDSVIITNAGYKKAVNTFENEGTLLTITDLQINGDVIIEGVAVRKVKLSNGVNLYRPTDSELDSLSYERFYPGGSPITPDGVENPFFDFGGFIHKLYILPFELPQAYITENKTNILLGSLKASTISDTILDYILPVNFGKIFIPKEPNNSYCYNGNCTLYLPYTDPITLDMKYIPGNTITIQGEIDLYNGLLTYNIFSSAVNKIIVTKAVTVAQEIPFIVRSYPGNTTGTVNEVLRNDVKNPYIIIDRKDIADPEGNPFGYKCRELATIIQGMGYIQFENILLNIPSIMDSELTELRNLILNGVIA